MNTMANKGIMCQSTMGQDMLFWAEADCRNFGSLLRGMGHCSAAARSSSVWEPMEASGSRGSRREAVEDMWCIFPFTSEKIITKAFPPLMIHVNTIHVIPSNNPLTPTEDEPSLG